MLGSDPGRTRSGRPRGEWYQRACSGPPGDPSWGPPVGLVVVQTFEATASGEPRAICIAEPKRSHGPLVACALSAIPTECGGVQARSETKRPSAVDTGRSIGANGCQVTNWLGCGVGAVDTFVAPDHLCRLHGLLHSVGGQHPEDHWHTG